MVYPMAINQLDKELNDRLMSYANTLARGDRALEQTLRQSAKSLGGAQQDVIAEYEEYLSKSRTWHGKEAEAAKDRLIRMRKLEQDADKAQQEGVDAKLKYNREMNKLCQQEQKLRDELNDQSKQLSARRKADISDQIARLKTQRSSAAEDFKAGSKERAARTDLGIMAAKERRAFENKELSATSKWGNAFRSSMTSVGQAALTKMFGSLSISAGVEKIAESFFTAVKEGTKHGTGLSYNPFGDNAISLFGAAKHGYDTKDWMNMLNSPETQRAVRSSQKGMYDFAAGLERVDKEVELYGISAKDRSEIARKNMELVTASGIRMQKEDATAFHDSMVQAKEAAGMAPDEFQKAMGEILSSEEVRTQLKMATSEQERRTIVDGIAAQLAQNKAMGLTTTEATAAAKALGKLAGEKPLERFKKAAKLRAMGAVMGMGAEGNRLADLTLKKKRTPEEEAEFKRLGSQMSERYTQTGADGNVSAEIMVTQVADKLGLEQMLGPNSPFNNTLSAAVAPLKEAGDSFSKTPAEITKAFAAIEQMFSSVKNNDLLAGAAGIAAGGYSLSKGGSLIKGLFSGGGAQTAAGGASKLGGLAKGAGVAGAAIDVGMGLNDLANGKAQESMSGLDYISPMRWGMFIGDKINKGMEGALGDSLGSKIYDWTHPDEANITAPVTIKKKESTTPSGAELTPPTADIKKKESTTPVPPSIQENTPASEAAKKDDEKHDAATTTAQNSKEQVKKLDAGNELLQQIAETTQRQVELSEKQLIAMTMTEKERNDSQNRDNLRKDNRFGSQYGYA